MGERSPGRTRDNLGRNRTFPKSKTPGACPNRGSHALWVSAGRGVRQVWITREPVNASLTLLLETTRPITSPVRQSRRLGSEGNW
jgi:hypothetical protein